MNYLEPFYYDDFKCVGNKCIEDCCHNWRITIDKKSFLKYRKVKGEFGKKLNNSIKRNRKGNSEYSYGSIVLDNGKCPLLNNEGLCELFIHEGEKSLCTTCTVYPREVFKYKNNIEKNLSLSCPEVAKKLVQCTEKFSFVLKDTKKEDEILYINYNVLGDRDELYNLLWDARNLAIDIAQLSEISLWKRLVLIKFLEGRLQKLITTNNMSDYERILDEFKDEIINFANVEEIHEVNNEIKIGIISEIISNNIFKTNIKELMEFLLNYIQGKEVKEVQEDMKEKEDEFNEYFKDREYIFENYLVYLLYSRFMKAITDKNLHKQIVIIMVDYACIKMLFMAKWLNNNKTLLEDDIIEIIYSSSRSLGHADVFFDRLYEILKKQGRDTPGYLATLIY